MSAENKLRLLRKRLEYLENLAVAFSGGVDSTFLLAVAKEVLGDRVIAITGRSSGFAERELRQCRNLAGRLGARQLLLPFEPLDIPGFADNPEDRCYLCKKDLLGKTAALARQNGIRFVADGSNADDLEDYRPGRRALQELGIISPLMEAGLKKDEIRTLSRRMNLPTWNKPADACLFSRFAYGERITAERLAMVDAAEQYLLAAGFKQVRVRVHGELARIEVGDDERCRFLKDNRMYEVDRCLKKLGFRYATLDLQGYRTGSMNEAPEEDIHLCVRKDKTTDKKTEEE